ncbi:MAG: DUF554 domain-containing protein, partial [Ruminococcus sp.]|nr:DUF554 domain-containing protein [Ruminococcus sp.]
MFGLLGTFVNVGTVLLGSCIGMLFNKKIPKRLTDSLFKALGLATIFIGVSGCLCGHSTILIIVSLIFGTLIGEIVDLDKGINKFGNFLESKFDKDNPNSRMAEGFVTASILFCIGSMTIVGCLNAGLKGDCTVLFAKSALDLCSSMIFASTMGMGVLFSAAFVLAYQGLLTVIAVWISPYLSSVVIDEMSCVGYIIIIGLGLTMVAQIKIKLTNMVP